MYRWFGGGLLLLAALSGCGSGSDDVQRALDAVLGVPSHQWAEIADMTGDGSADIVSVSQVLDGNRVELNVFEQSVAGGYRKWSVLLGSQARYRVSHVFVNDLDADGMPDVVVSHVGYTSAGVSPGREISVLLKSGLGAIDFEPRLIYAVGDNPLNVSSGDVDLDGLPDLAVATRDGIDLLIQDGGNPGRFLPARRLGNRRSLAVHIEDMNGDGIDDLLSASDTVVELFLNDPGRPGALDIESSWALDDWPSGLTVGDFNADGWLDFALCHSESDQIDQASISGRLQDPLQPGNFGAPFSVAMAAVRSLGSIDSADLDGDGDDDLVVAVTGGESGRSIGVLLASAGGTFPAASYYNSNQVSGPWSARIGQLNSDGLLDVVLAHVIYGVFTHSGRGAGDFSDARKIGE